MKYIKCMGEIIDGYCTKCGYLDTNYFVKNSIDIDKDVNIKLYNIDFNIMNTNSNGFISLFMGPIYFSYRDHFTLGFILSNIDFLIILFLLELSMQSFILVYFLFIYLVTSRVLLYMFSNMVCLKLDRIKIRLHEKKKESDRFMLTHNSRNYLLVFITILSMIFTMVTFFTYITKFAF